VILSIVSVAEAIAGRVVDIVKTLSTSITIAWPLLLLVLCTGIWKPVVVVVSAALWVDTPVIN